MSAPQLDAGTVPGVSADPVVTVRRVGPEAAAAVLAVVLEAFSERPPLDPPAAALAETEASLGERLAAYGGLLAEVDGAPAGALVLDPGGPEAPDRLYLRRVGVLPRLQHHHVAAALIQAAVRTVATSPEFVDLAVVAREELPATVRFWERQGFREVRRDSPDVELHRPVRTVVRHAADADDTRELGRRLAARLQPGDLVVLSGSLGAGKTTFTQGLGAGLGVRGAVTSPTFVIARVHPGPADGPALVHVDAYRLGGLAELDDLDLDTDLDRAVTVVEWGEGLAEGLADSRLDVHLVRAEAGDPDPSPDGETDAERHDERRLELTPVGPRWAHVDLAEALDRDQRTGAGEGERP